MSEKPVRVLVSGDVNGAFQSLIQRVKYVVRKNGSFDMLICVGEFFGPNEETNMDVINGKTNFPVTTYILGPCCPATSSLYPDECIEFSPNLTYLGKKGILSLTSGLQIAYLSGIEGSKENKIMFDSNTVQKLLISVKASSGFLGVDLLLTSVWPAEVWKHSPNQPSKMVDGSVLVSKLAAGLKPRYHFAGLGTHYERSPYRNHRVLQEAAQHVTRFIGLSAVDNTNREKWLYAFSISPMRKMSRSDLTLQPPNASEFPYMDVLTRMVLKDQESANLHRIESDIQYFFDMSEEAHDPFDRGGRKRRNFTDGPRAQNARVEECWFCLSNIDVEKYLIVSVASECYLAMPKGPLTNDHVMILSVGHIQSMSAAPEAVRNGIEQFKKSLTMMYEKMNKVCVFFERNYKTHHLQVQVVPVPRSRQKVLRSSFLNAATIKNMELSELGKDEKIWDVVNEGRPYFWVELPDGIQLFTLKMQNFPLQFGREVLAGAELLDCEDKIDWRSCEIEKEEQEKMVKRLRKAIEPFEPAESDDDDDDDNDDN
ncbi:hypothetical protein AB6A40_008352 [Gnathostoma spinigerum]|uniref:CWF19-like protein 1 n=1 Tax=Gnathostoma spinigerum TaxID=75299 RepID=A0ABD6EX43_9BILA